jgi:hypothetical protein
MIHIRACIVVVVVVVASHRSSHRLLNYKEREAKEDGVFMSEVEAKRILVETNRMIPIAHGTKESSNVLHVIETG